MRTEQRHVIRPERERSSQVTIPQPSTRLRAKDLPPAVRNQIPIGDRELDVMLLARAGMGSKQIGCALGISGRTVEIYKQRARRMFGEAPMTLMVLMLDRLLHKEEF